MTTCPGTSHHLAGRSPHRPQESQAPFSVLVREWPSPRAEELPQPVCERSGNSLRAWCSEVLAVLFPQWVCGEEGKWMKHNLERNWRHPGSRASPVALVVKNLPASAGDIRDTSSTPGSGRSPGGGHGNPLQYSCLENPMDRGAWWATVHGVTKRWTRLERLSTDIHRSLGSILSLAYGAPTSYLLGCVIVVFTDPVVVCEGEI